MAEVVTNAKLINHQNRLDYDRAKEKQEFENTKAGVKGLVDSGMVKIPKFFIHPPESQPKDSHSSIACLQIPVIDLEGLNGELQGEIVDKIRRASEEWGFFQIVNHGIPAEVLDEMIRGIRSFHEQPAEAKRALYTFDSERNVRYHSNGYVRESQEGEWKDTLSCSFHNDELDLEELPMLCRHIMVEYVKCMRLLKDTLAKLLSQALNLNPDYLNNIECMRTQGVVGNYYPPCPEPHLTFGTSKHSDPAFLTILLQDHIGGLQVLYEDQWVNVPPVRGALVINIGDLLQLITNDMFKSVEHRALSGHIGPRISVATFFYPNMREPKTYGPIKELLSENNLPFYKDILVPEYIALYSSKRLEGKSGLPYFKL
ncbi:hypothetical protein GIB67_039574 [Kingdonia uniflora]|uniref:Fe2OG dioxygenase domain-containing protein n=1 Tax=Kingdonia uniflora TaxID=39325 RepID=A0A7J7P6G0_9MAGN|nr:hypothetical protein GIB67_039574 [Kingdonia uniflora]